MIQRDCGPRLKLAAAAFLLSAFSFFGLLLFPLFVLSAFALPLAAFSFVQSRRCNGGTAKAALVSGVLSITALVIAPPWYVHLYNAEACADHERVEFSRIGNGTGLDSYAGRSICVKGYAFSNRSSEPTTTIYINPDGNGSALKTIVEVHLPFRWRRTEDPIAVSGILIINDLDDRPRYTLRAVDVRPAKTRIGLENRNPSSGC